MKRGKCQSQQITVEGRNWEKGSCYRRVSARFQRVEGEKGQKVLLPLGLGQPIESGQKERDGDEKRKNPFVSKISDLGEKGDQKGVKPGQTGEAVTMRGGGEAKRRVQEGR